MQSFWSHSDSTLSTDIFFILLTFNDVMQVLKIRNVTRTSKNCRLIDFVNSLQIGISGKSSVISHCIGSNNDSIFVFESKNRGSNNAWILRMRFLCQILRWIYSIGMWKLVISRRIGASLPKWWSDIISMQKLKFLQKFLASARDVIKIFPYLEPIFRGCTSLILGGWNGL